MRQNTYDPVFKEHLHVSAAALPQAFRLRLAQRCCAFMPENARPKKIAAKITKTTPIPVANSPAVAKRENGGPAFAGLSLTGPAGLEPATPGFGDRCSAS